MEENEELEELELKNEVQENGEIDAPKTYSQEEVDEMMKQKADEYEKSFNEKFNTRWGKEQRKSERNNKKERELINLLKTQTGTEDIDDLLNLSYEQYNVDRPRLSEDEEDLKVLGKYDAQSILSLDLEDIEEEVNRLAGIKRNAREEATFLELGKYLTDSKKKESRKKEFEDLGIGDQNLLEDENFKTYMSKFRDETPLKDIYENYKLTQPKKKKPFEEGSVQDIGTISNEVKDFYTYEESLKFSKKDFDKNPKLFQAVQNSMTKWGKK